MKKQLLLILSISGLFLYILFLSSWKAINNKHKTRYQELRKESNISIQDTTSGKDIYGISLDSFRVIEGTIRRNQNIADILSEYEVQYQELYNLTRHSGSDFDFRKVKSGKNYKILCKKDSTHKASCFIYESSPKDFYVMNFGEAPGIRKGSKQVDTTLRIASGIIENSLYISMKNKGHSPAIINQLSEIFAWQIDFFRIDKGDRYKVIYEELSVDDKPFKIGKIRGAYFKHRDEDYYAYYFPEDGNYYDDEGNSMQKVLLKAPLNFSRVSSGFSHNRYHPVLKIYRPHHGVDYAAPRGTPVVSVGNGKVVAASYSKGAGYYIKIRHNSVYLTKYLHLSGFAKGIRTGSSIKQGEVIGYVGSTGLSTGPHLDYRVVKHGRYVNPLNLDLPPSHPVPEEQIDTFKSVKKQTKKYLDKIFFDHELQAQLEQKPLWPTMANNG